MMLAKSLHSITENDTPQLPTEVGFEGSDNEWREEYLLGPWVLGLRFRVIGV